MKIKNLLKDTVIYGFSSYLSLIVSFFLTPIYTRTLTKEEYGIMDLFTTWNNIFILLIPLGLASAILRQYNDFNKSEKIKNKYLGTLFFSLIFMIFIYSCNMFLLSHIIEKNYFKTGINYNIYYLSIFIVSFTVLTSYFQSLNRIQFKKYTYAFINVIGFVILASLGFYLVVIDQKGVLGFFIAATVSSGTVFIIALVLGVKEIKFQYDFAILKSALRYSLPLLFVLIFIKFTYLIDRYIINSFLELKDVGEYSIVLRVNNIYQIMIGAFTTAWFPYAMQLKDSKDRNKGYQKAYKLYLVVFSIIAFFIILYSKELFLFFAPSYLNVLSLVFFIIPTTFIGGFAYFFGLGIHIHKKTEYFIISSLFSFLVNFIISWFLVKYIGLYGIALGSLISIIVWVLIDYYYSNKLENITFKFINSIYALSFIGISILIVLLLNAFVKNDFISLIIKTFISFIVLFYVIKDSTILNNLKLLKNRKL